MTTAGTERAPGRPGGRAGVALERLASDVAAAAEVAGARYDRRVIASVLEAFEESFAHGAVSFRTTTRARTLNVRYVELGQVRDPYPTAVAAGLLPTGDGPVERLLASARDTCPLLGYGLDFGVDYGVEKIWPFFPQSPQPLARVAAMPELPTGVADHVPLLRRHGLESVSLFGVDFRHATANVYFMVPPGSLSAATVRSLVEQLGFAPPSAEVLHHCTRAVPVYLTFSWQHRRAERLCFACMAPAAELPTDLDPLFARYAAGVPFAGSERLFIYNVAFVQDGLFFKVENDYTGTMTAQMRAF